MRISHRSGMVLNAIVGSAHDIQQISKAMFKLDQSSQENASSAQKIATESNEVNTLALDALELSRELNQIILGDQKAA